jgi:molybdopterin/thiamine biosynthesis adenylyltransferase
MEELRCERFSKLYAGTLPQFIEKPHIVAGCGAIGGVICRILGQIGVENVTLWDHDTVEEVNLGPQGFYEMELGMQKVESRHNEMILLFEKMKVCPQPTRFKTKNDHPEDAIWWLMVDSLDTRQRIFETAIHKKPYKMIDARMGGLVYEVYNIGPEDDTRYLDTIEFARRNPVDEGCTTRSTPHCAMIAGAIAVNLALSPSPPFCIKGDLMAYNQEVIW